MKKEYKNEYESFMKQWDRIRFLIASGDRGSLPRDMFENILGILYERIEDLEKQIEDEREDE